MEYRHDCRLQKRHTEERGAASGEENFLAEPRDDGEIERQRTGPRDGRFSPAKVDERATGQRQDDDSEHEPIAPRKETEQDASPEDHQRYRVRGNGERVWKSSRHYQRGGERKNQRRSDQRAAHFPDSSFPEASYARLCIEEVARRVPHALRPIFSIWRAQSSENEGLPPRWHRQVVRARQPDALPLGAGMDRLVRKVSTGGASGAALDFGRRRRDRATARPFGESQTQQELWLSED